MPDSEKVIESLEMCERDGCGFNCTRCHYETDTKRSCIENLMHDALALLKEQDEIIKNLKMEKLDELKEERNRLLHEYQQKEMMKVAKDHNGRSVKGNDK